MLSLIHAIGGLGRSVSDTARHALAGADRVGRWRKLALYVAMFALPGGSIAVLLFMWIDRRRAQRTATATKAGAHPLPAAAAQPCTGGQPACRAACATPRMLKSRRRPALRCSRGNEA